MTLETAIRGKNVSEIRRITKESTVADITTMLEALSSKERVIFFRLLNTDLQSDLFAALEPEYQEQLLKSFTDKQMKEIVSELYIDELADLIEDVPDSIAQKILGLADNDTRAQVNKILRYSDDQTGSVMNVDIVTIKQSSTVAAARKLIRDKKEDARLAHYFFVVDSKDRLAGHIALEDLLFEDSEKKIRSITKPVSFVTTTTDKEAAALKFAEQDMSVLPVVNTKKEVIGMITSEDVIDIFQDEATEDIHKMAGIGVDDQDYSKQSTFAIFKSRIIWLLLLMISATLSQIVLDSFITLAQDKIEGTHATATNATIGAAITTAMFAILPVISGAAGNAGSQSSTTVIRALATGDISTRDYFKVIFKESKASFVIGLTLAIVNFARLLIYYAIKNQMTEAFIMLSLSASISLFVVIMLAKVVGGALPLIAKMLRLDPAVMAAPLLTTLIDALSTAIFFGVSITIMVMVI